MSMPPNPLPHLTSDPPRVMILFSEARAHNDAGKLRIFLPQPINQCQCPFRQQFGGQRLRALSPYLLETSFASLRAPSLRSPGPFQTMRSRRRRGGRWRCARVEGGRLWRHWGPPGTWDHGWSHPEISMGLHTNIRPLHHS